MKTLFAGLLLILLLAVDFNASSQPAARVALRSHILPNIWVNFWL